MTTVEQLTAEKEALEKRLAEAKLKVKIDNVARVRALMSETGVTVADINRARRSGNKPPPKYVDPESGSTWSGFGRPPKWAAGKDLKDLGRLVP